MGDVFAGVILADFAIFEPNGAGIRTVIKTGFNPVVPKNIILIFSHIIAKQFGNKNLVCTILTLNTENGAFWGGVYIVNDLLQVMLSACDYISKMASSFCVQSAIPLWQNSQSVRSSSQVLLMVASMWWTKSASSAIRCAHVG